jgi:hypothetical protein
MLQTSHRGRFAKLTGPIALAACVLGLAAVLLGADSTESDEATRVLLVGNSYTQFHMLPRLVERLGASANTPLQVDAVTHSGYTLRRHWIRGPARERIARGGYHFVVLQDHSLRPIDRPAEFDDYGQRFLRAAVSVGAAPVLYQTWAPGPRSPFYRQRAKSASAPLDANALTAQLEHAYGELARREAARLAPVGRAFARALEAHADVELYGPDGTHPSWAGSYLAACVLYGTLTSKDPRAATYAPWELKGGQAPRLREVAAAVLDEQR